MEASQDIVLAYTVCSTDASAALGLRVRLDDIVVYENSHVTQQERIQHTLPDTDAAHELSFELFGKLPVHTKIDQNGAIVSDAMLSIMALEFDGIDISSLMVSLAEYHHDFNGSQDPVVDEFYGAMGCNGTVTLKFTTPIYLWLLENM